MSQDINGKGDVYGGLGLAEDGTDDQPSERDGLGASEDRTTRRKRQSPDARASTDWLRLAESSTDTHQEASAVAIQSYLDDTWKRDIAKHKAIIAAGRKRLKLLRQASFLLTTPTPASSNEASQ